MPQTAAPMRLATAVRPYDWGSVTALPELFGTEPTGRPQAELWMGAHPGDPSTVDGTPLDRLIAGDPTGTLGERAATRFGPVLPYLLKVLAIERPLSLQVHPTSEQAAAGFAEENARGIALDDFARTYKDSSHKPEMVCAITPFHGLCGFREPAATAALLERLGLPDLRPWIDTLRTLEPGAALRAVFSSMLDDASRPLRAQVERALLDLGPLGRDGDDLAVHADIARACPGDPGVVAALLLHHVTLLPGQALYLGAGVPHAYLGGIGVEIMANSDNVLRCGLTTKHIDVPELMRVVDFTPGDPFLVRPEDGGPGEHHYRPPVPEFALTRYDLGAGNTHTIPGGEPQIVVCIEGEARLGAELTLRPGESAFVPAAAPPTSLTGKGTTYRALPSPA
ncbi:mannose-6-phosphate isomerase, class I [Nonomuraea jiangxiensis]|uniref:mannose-6-phosphate isomerase n=1 Tax=Nonomuraea jiangxiensis TaxID=633440 RepID=A0A1G9AQT3_9ACTN|nr:mannose-6-phosphate isomerase, class I [Nonomuraea jiangxiensis]SDK29607.1 mannose-6-phosphate isomerase [Nonomuraea jiangxiensis]